MRLHNILFGCLPIEWTVFVDLTTEQLTSIPGVDRAYKKSYADYGYDLRIDPRYSLNDIEKSIRDMDEAIGHPCVEK